MLPISLICSFVKLDSDVMPAYLKETHKGRKVSRYFPKHSLTLEFLSQSWVMHGLQGECRGTGVQGGRQLLTQVAFELTVLSPQPPTCLATGIHHHSQLTSCLRYELWNTSVKYEMPRKIHPQAYR